MYLNPRWDVVDDADGFAIGVTRQRVGDDVVLHLPCWLVARFHAVDGFTGGTLEAEIKKPTQSETERTGPSIAKDLVMRYMISIYCDTDTAIFSPKPQYTMRKI